MLIIGASGGVGTYAVQLAKAFGATVTGGGQHRESRSRLLVVSQRLTMFISGTNHRQADLEALRQQIEAGHVTPIVGKTYPLPDVPKAIRHLEEGRAQGKIAITV